MNQGIFTTLSFLMDVVLPVCFGVFALLFFGRKYLKKKGKGTGTRLQKQGKKAEFTSKTAKRAKKLNISEFNVIEDFEENMIVTQNKTKFTSGVYCEGVSMSNLSSFERNLIEKNTLGYNSMITWNLQYYIQTVQADSEEISEFTRDSIEAIKVEYANLTARLAQLTEASMESSAREEYYRSEIEETKRLLKCLRESLDHKDEIMAYCKAVTMPGSEPQFNLYILFSYVYDPSLFTEQLLYEEILKEARNFIENKSAAIKDAMKKCMVKCREMNLVELSEMVHRGYNLSDASIVRFKDLLKTSQFDLYTTTDYFEQSRLLYALEKIDNDLLGEEVAIHGEKAN